MPEEKYTWNESGVDIILHNFENNNIVIMKKIVFFFSTLAVPYVKDGIVKKFMEADFDTLGKICLASVDDILTLLKFGYPAEKIKWYRGGMQNWQALGLSTVKPK